jgi:hypothetical protein
MFTNTTNTSNSSSMGPASNIAMDYRFLGLMALIGMACGYSDIGNWYVVPELSVEMLFGACANAVVISMCVIGPTSNTSTTSTTSTPQGIIMMQHLARRYELLLRLPKPLPYNQMMRDKYTCPDMLGQKPGDVRALYTDDEWLELKFLWKRFFQNPVYDGPGKSNTLDDLVSEFGSNHEVGSKYKMYFVPIAPFATKFPMLLLADADLDIQDMSKALNSPALDMETRSNSCRMYHLMALAGPLQPRLERNYPADCMLTPDFRVDMQLTLDTLFQNVGNTLRHQAISYKHRIYAMVLHSLPLPLPMSYEHIPAYLHDHNEALEKLLDFGICMDMISRTLNLVLSPISKEEMDLLRNEPYYLNLNNLDHPYNVFPSMWLPIEQSKLAFEQSRQDLFFVNSGVNGQTDIDERDHSNALFVYLLRLLRPLRITRMGLYAYSVSELNDAFSKLFLSQKFVQILHLLLLTLAGAPLEGPTAFYDQVLSCMEYNENKSKYPGQKVGFLRKLKPNQADK